MLKGCEAGFVQYSYGKKCIPKYGNDSNTTQIVPAVKNFILQACF